MPMSPSEMKRIEKQHRKVQREMKYMARQQKIHDRNMRKLHRELAKERKRK